MGEHSLIKEIRIHARANLGVEYKTDWNFFYCGQEEKNDPIYFSCFQNYSGVKGNGGIALYILCEAATYLDRSIILFTTRPRLCSWYETFGFRSLPRTSHTFQYIRRP